MYWHTSTDVSDNIQQDSRDDPDFLEYHDMRSAERCSQREHKQRQKYYGYRGKYNNPSVVGQKFLSHDPAVTQIRSLWKIASTRWELSTHAQIRIWTRRDWFSNKEDDIWPLDVRHSKSRARREKRAWKRDCDRIKPRYARCDKDWSRELEQHNWTDEVMKDVENVSGDSGGWQCLSAHAWDHQDYQDHLQTGTRELFPFEYCHNLCNTSDIPQQDINDVAVSETSFFGRPGLDVRGIDE